MNPLIYIAVFDLGNDTLGLSKGFYFDAGRNALRETAFLKSATLPKTRTVSVPSGFRSSIVSDGGDC